MSLLWTSLDTWIVVTGILSASACALLGNFLVLRKMSMMGDAISHAVLPGIAIGFLVSGSRDSPVMFLGAIVAGMLTAVFTQWINRLGKVEESTSMGVVFTALFALGIILIVRGADKVDLDPGCVLYGAIEMVPLNTVDLAGFDVPRAVVMLSIVFLVNVVVVFLLFKEFKISAFDPALATTQGINADFMHYLLMSLVAVTTVAAFESVGSILVIAMLIVPAATAHLLTDRLRPMILWSLVIAVGSAVLGHLSAITVPGIWGFSDTITSGMMAVVSGMLFTTALFFSPRHGIVSKFYHRGMLHLRMAGEDILGMLFRFDEMEHPPAKSEQANLVTGLISIGPLTYHLARSRLKQEGKITLAGDGMELTEAGRAVGRTLIRSHRLWESYLYKHLAIRADHVHAAAEQLEHLTGTALQQRLDEDVERPVVDPQGKKIPPG